MMSTVPILSNDWTSPEERARQVNGSVAPARAISFRESVEVRKIESDNRDALLLQRTRLSLRRFSNSVPGPRLASAVGSRKQKLSARGITLAPNQQGALVAKKMDETDRPIEEPGRAGVTVLAEEID
jgi:hypothetical protein